MATVKIQNTEESETEPEPKPTKQWLEGYEAGGWAQMFPKDFPADQDLMSNPEFKAGFDQGFEDSEADS